MLEKAKKHIKNLNFYNFCMCLIIFLGIFLRLKGYLYNSSFWHDECALAWNIKFKSYPQLFSVLNFLQVSPPLFLVVTKFFTGIWGYSEKVFRFIPLIFGCFSLIAFYFLSKKVLSSKISVLVSVFLFAINQSLIGYCFEFKSYGLDVFFVVICLLFFINLAVEDLNKKEAILYGAILSIIPWFSFTSVFILASGFLNLFFNKIKSSVDRKIFLMLPLVISVGIYLKVSLFSNYTGTSMVSGWQGYFITLNIKHFLWLFKNNMEYLFWPCSYILFLSFFLICGMVLFYREKSYFFKLFLMWLAAFFLFSFFRFYPFAERLILFMVPMLLPIMVKPLDLISKERKIVSGIIITLFFVTFYPQVKYLGDLLVSDVFDKQEYPREMMNFMVRKIRPTDIIFVNNPSEPEYEYYSSFHDIKNKVIQERILQGLSEKSYLEELNTLKDGYYWFFLPDDYVTKSVIPIVEKWAQKQDIIYSYKTGMKYKGLLMYVHVIRGKS